ncbi:hypothetical protein AAHC03_017177 [Spirometra sp. Aus1]
MLTRGDEERWPSRPRLFTKAAYRAAAVTATWRQLENLAAHHPDSQIHPLLLHNSASIRGTTPAIQSQPWMNDQATTATSGRLLRAYHRLAEKAASAIVSRPAAWSERCRQRTVLMESEAQVR